MARSRLCVDQAAEAVVDAYRNYVGQAVADYLVDGRRPSSSRSVFLPAAGAPIGVSRNAVVFVSRTASGRAQIAVVGEYRLRHTAGTELLRGGASLPDRHRPALIGDLRHTFAVTTILSWHRTGTDVQQQLPVLSAYLGHVNPAQTYWYLHGTPELMILVAERLERSSEPRR